MGKEVKSTHSLACLVSNPSFTTYYIFLVQNGEDNNNINHIVYIISYVQRVHNIWLMSAH